MMEPLGYFFVRTLTRSSPITLPPPSTITHIGAVWMIKHDFAHEN